MNWLINLFKLLWKMMNDSGKLNPVPVADPGTSNLPDITKPPDPIPLTHIIVLDLDTQPEEMRQAGIPGRDTALWYVCNGKLYPGWEWPEAEAKSDPEGVVLWGMQDRIVAWMQAKVDKAVKLMRENPTLTATIIANDGPDKCGSRVGPVILQHFQEFGNRVQLGDVYTP